MTNLRYRLRIPGLSRLDVSELLQALGTGADAIIPDRPAEAHGDLGLITISVLLGGQALAAALLYFGGRDETKTTLRLAVQIEEEGGTTTTNVVLELDSSQKAPLSDQAMKQIAAALKVKLSDISGLP